MARPQAKAPTRPARRPPSKPSNRRAARYVYAFGAGKTDGRANMKDLLGGKGANLAEMSRLKLPVPPGFTISTEVCTYYYAHGRTYPAPLKSQIAEGLRRIEKALGRRFGDPERPLLVSVRSGARASMPGMMDTILNLGLNDRTVAAIIKETGNARFAYDSYRRFVQMYGDVVLGLKPEGKDEEDPFEIALQEKKRERGVTLDTELDAEALRELVDEFKTLIKMRKGVLFPEDPQEQLAGAIGAVFGSWMNQRAITYRKLNGIPETWGTAVNVQAMVFGNMGADSGTGVAFTRDPATGDNVFYGEFLMDAQGEDVVAGTRTPLPIASLERENRTAYGELLSIRRTLERHYRDMMDIEFTIQQQKLYMLQCRVGKRTAFAAIKIAVDMVREKLISTDDALKRVDPEQLNQLLRPIFDAQEKERAIAGKRRLARGLNAGPGAATGHVVFNAEDAETAAARGEPVILVRIETSPEDIGGMSAARGILTARGGMTSHAALVARQMGKVCVAGCEALTIDYSARTMRIADRSEVVKEGDFISLDGSSGEVFAGQIATTPSEVVRVLVDRTLEGANAPVYQMYAQLMKWADKARRLRIRANADQPDQGANAIAFGAEGVGLCRTEHMFFGEGKIGPMRETILAATVEERRAALAKLLPLQRDDFEGLFRAMAGRPVTIRTLDPPLHEFLPHDEAGQREVADSLGVPLERVRERVEALHEFNPMLGFRGCRLGIMFPEITEMQVRAIFEAAARVRQSGIAVEPEVMIPLVGHVKELALQTEVVRRIAKQVMAETGTRFRYLVGTMIEVPRGALTADEIAGTAEFFSFGTNDLTQMTLGVSRDDAARFLVPYVHDFEIYAKDPFESIDRNGVGTLMRVAVEKGRTVNGKLKLGICGEHGGDPASIAFCHQIGLDYVSCSPFRVPIARLAAARAALGV
jgi:pyruvate, orthophosphate dikinase